MLGTVEDRRGEATVRKGNDGVGSNQGTHCSKDLGGCSKREPGGHCQGHPGKGHRGENLHGNVQCLRDVGRPLWLSRWVWGRGEVGHMAPAQVSTWVPSGTKGAGSAQVHRGLHAPCSHRPLWLSGG